jgi:hypothetical protein
MPPIIMTRRSMACQVQLAQRPNHGLPGAHEATARGKVAASKRWRIVFRFRPRDDHRVQVQLNAIGQRANRDGYRIAAEPLGR